MFMMRATLFAFGLLCFLLTSCSSNKKKAALKPVDLVSIEASVKLEKLWQTDIGKGQDKRYSKFLPAIDTDVLYVTDVKGVVSAIDVKKGKVVWRQKLLGKAISAGIRLFGNTLYLATYDGELLALDKEDGRFLWAAEASSEILALPAANQGLVVVQTIDGRLFGFNTDTGEQVWRYDHQVPALTVRGLANPQINNGILIAAFGNGQVVALDVGSGAPKWTGRVSQPRGLNELERIVDVDGGPLLHDSFVLTSSYQGAIAAFLKANGNPVWKRDLSSYLDLSAEENAVYAVDEDSHVLSFNVFNGNTNWVNDDLHRRQLSSPLAKDGYVFVTDLENYLHVLSAEDGELVGRIKLNGKGYSASPQVLNDNILLLSNDGELTAYSILN